MEMVKPTIVTLQANKEQEFSAESELELPVVISNKILLSPGNWNGVEFSAESIKEAFD